MAKRRLKSESGWGIDKRVSLTNVAQFIVVVIACVTFYNQVNNNQARNEERFTSYADERKVSAAAFIEMQKIQQQQLLELTKINERENYITDSLKDLTATVKAKGSK